MAEGTVVVANIRGFGRFTQTAGNEAAARLDARFARLAREETEALGGRCATHWAGEITVLFDSASQAVRAALELQRRFRREMDAAPGPPLAVGIGIATGTYAEAAGTYVGTTIKLAQRLCALAGPGAILTSDPVPHPVDDMSAASLVERGLVQLEGFPDPITVFELVSPRPEMDKV